MDLALALKGVYFDQIAAGTKTEEFRLCTPYWAKRLEGRAYSRVVVTRGYPKATDETRRLAFPWRGFSRRWIQHEFFGADPVEVYAIRVEA